MKFKNVKYLFLFLPGIFLSCNNNEEPVYPEYFPIEYEFETEYRAFNRAELTSEELAAMPDKSFVIYSEDDFPDEDLMGLQQIKDSDIDFNKYTLLLNYERIPGFIVAHLYSWSKDIKEDSYNFSMTFFSKHENDNENPVKDIYTYCRTAVLVERIPFDSMVQFWYSVQETNNR